MASERHVTLVKFGETLIPKVATILNKSPSLQMPLQSINLQRVHRLASKLGATSAILTGSRCSERGPDENSDIDLLPAKSGSVFTCWFDGEVSPALDLTICCLQTARMRIAAEADQGQFSLLHALANSEILFDADRDALNF